MSAKNESAKDAKHPASLTRRCAVSVRKIELLEALPERTSLALVLGKHRAPICADVLPDTGVG